MLLLVLLLSNKLLFIFVGVVLRLGGGKLLRMASDWVESRDVLLFLE